MCDSATSSFCVLSFCLNICCEVEVFLTYWLTYWLEDTICNFTNLATFLLGLATFQTLFSNFNSTKRLVINFVTYSDHQGKAERLCIVNHFLACSRPWLFRGQRRSLSSHHLRCAGGVGQAGGESMPLTVGLQLLWVSIVMLLPCSLNWKCQKWWETGGDRVNFTATM